MLKFFQNSLRNGMVQEIMGKEEKLKNEDEKCASMTTLLGIIFLFFSFLQKACLNF